MTAKMTGLWWWIDRWRKSTAFTDLTLEAQGAYRNLIDEATLRGGGLPNDERILAKVCGDQLAWPHLRDLLLARFELKADGCWHHDTLDQVLREGKRRAKKQSEWRKRKKAAGNDGGNASGNGGGNTPGLESSHDASHAPVYAGGNNEGYPDPDPDPDPKTYLPTDTYGAAAAARFPQPVENPRPEPGKPASEWKRALAIAHAVMDAWPANTENWYPETKTRLQEQHLDPRGRSPRGGALFQDAVDFAAQQREQRAARRAH